MGIENLKKIVVFLAVLASAGDKATQDGLSFEDAGIIIPALMGAPAALSGMDQAKLEAKDLDTAELAELNVAVADALDLTNDKVEAIVEKSLVAIVNIYGIIQDIRALRSA